jgi:hypothetical protein
VPLTHVVVWISPCVDILVADDSHESGDTSQHTQTQDTNNGDLGSPWHLQPVDDEKWHDGASPVDENLSRGPDVAQNQESVGRLAFATCCPLVIKMSREMLRAQARLPRLTALCSSRPRMAHSLRIG